jgi:alkaline phosphatase
VSPADIDADMWQDHLADAFGLDGTGLSTSTDDELDAFQKQRLEAAFDKSLNDESENLPEEDQLLYGYYEPITVTITHILNEQAGLAWTSYSHTGVPVPVLAIGRGAYLFDGFYDNTDVAKKIAQATGLDLNN